MTASCCCIVPSLPVSLLPYLIVAAFPHFVFPTLLPPLPLPFPSSSSFSHLTLVHILVQLTVPLNKSDITVSM